MYGGRRPFRPRAAAPPHLPSQNPYHSPYPRNSNPFFQNPNIFSSPPSNPYIQSPTFAPPPPQTSHRILNRDEHLERIERAVGKAHRDLLAAGESISVWKVSQSALVSLQVDSLSSLGFQLQDIPSLYRLIAIESKINAFIHCFVGVRKVTSLYDLDIAICKNEGVDRFEELGMGPLLRNPIVEHYFLVPPDATEIHKITSEEIISLLIDYMDSSMASEIQADDFLNFLAKRGSLATRERLGIRIQSLGMHISFIRKARTTEKGTLKRHLQSFQHTSDRTEKHVLDRHTSDRIVSEKQALDRRFKSISNRVKLLSSLHEGKHIRFISSSSDDDNVDDVENNCSDDDSSVNCCDSSKSKKSNDQRVSSCPYPSASEELLRLGIKSEMDGHEAPTCVSVKENESKKLFERKRKARNAGGDYFTCKLEKTDKGKAPGHSLQICERKKSSLEKQRKKLPRINAAIEDIGNDDQEEVCSFRLTEDDLRKFITTWKETCREGAVDEVFDKMLKYYGSSRKLKLIFSSYPGIGLLNVAVVAIKHGMWDSLYDTLQGMGDDGFMDSNPLPYMEVLDIGASCEKDLNCTNNEAIPVLKQSVAVDDIINKIAKYIEINHIMPKDEKLQFKDQISFLRQLHDCEGWLIKQFSVKDFSSLGYGDYLAFLEKHASLLCQGLHTKTTEIVVSIGQQQLLLMLSQAVSEVGEIRKEQILSLIKRQFPLINVHVRGGDPGEEFLGLFNKQKSNEVMRSVLFSVALLGTRYDGDLVQCFEHSSKVTVSKTELRQYSDFIGSSGEDAIKCLLKAPMLADLRSWSHWDHLFAPTLGPLMEWLLDGAYSKELLFIVTIDGKLIRIQRSVSVDEFLEAVLQGSSSLAALKLLSLLALYGGMTNVPLSLLKCYANQAFGVIIKKSVTSGVKNVPFSYDKTSSISVAHASNFGMKTDTPNSTVVANDTTNKELSGSLCLTNEVIRLVSKFILDCVACLPSEFHSFAMDVLYSGLLSFTKDAPSVLLRECNQTEHRIMLHDIGLSLGILEWIDDYHAFNSATTLNVYGTLNPVFDMQLDNATTSADIARCTDGKMANFGACSDLPNARCEVVTEVSTGKYNNKVSAEIPADSCTPLLSEDSGVQDASLVIESIRRDEFGLDPNLKFHESSLLKKQHDRLGRALRCLSQELYSQDSHFLLELVQNADDNIYSNDVEPTLVFILQPTGIVVLNNEKGFSAQNIRALCDVGNSTKKGSNSGYIGQKGIGFKSVFRVTDAPEIHSNGFHVKFDASEGLIGLVLPTVISPCDINVFTKQLFGKDDQTAKCWKTCISLPFKSKLRVGAGLTSITSMLSDLNPSLLLFLHRLRCIILKNMLNDSFIVMRKEIVGNGIVKVSYDNYKMIWLVTSQTLRASAVRPELKTTEISLAFTLLETSDGLYEPHLEQQPVFSFLPLRAYGLKFILQGNFVLPSSREEVDADSAWNQWLLSEFPALFVNAERSFCALPCFCNNLGKAVTTFMSFVPLPGEVHGFFSRLPHMIISKLVVSNCLLLEGRNMQWVPPCRVLRGWNEQARIVLPENLLQQHLGLGFMNKDIILSDPLAKFLNIQEYEPTVLVKFMSSICQINDDIKLMGLEWLSSWLDALYATLSVHPSARTTHLNSTLENDLVKTLWEIPFIPLSDGSYGSLDGGPIWLPCDASDSNAKLNSNDFPYLYAKLRTVSPSILSAESIGTYGANNIKVDNVKNMLLRIGVQRLSAHEVIKAHIFPALSSNTIADKDSLLMIEYLCFVMIHLHTACPVCSNEREQIMSELQKKALILTNHGYKCLSQVSVHFSKEYGNPIDTNKLVDGDDAEWHVLDAIYLNHPSTLSLTSSLTKWREFFLELGVTDFIRVIHIKRSVEDVLHTNFWDMKSEGDYSSPKLMIEDWESPDLVKFFTTLSVERNKEKCKYILEVLDNMWDDYFCERATGTCIFDASGSQKPVVSSLVKSIHEHRWVASINDEQLHFPKDLFYDCEAVQSIVGPIAPYAVPQVQSKKFLNAIGFKTQVKLDDAFDILRYWKRRESSFRTSIAQMSRFYTFIADEIILSKEKIVEELRSGAIIFVPNPTKSRHGDIVYGLFLSPTEVYWNDPTGAVDHMKGLVDRHSSIDAASSFLTKILVHIYPSLGEFFVKVCGVNKVPPLCCYLQILLDVTRIALPSEVADVVLRIFVKLADDLKLGAITLEEVSYLKEFLLKLENAVLPTMLDKWVSLHPNFAITCWCDNKELMKQLGHPTDADFIYFDKLNDDDNETIASKVSVLMQAIGVPALSEVVTREAVYYGMDDCTDKASLVNWALPYAQRYISKVHPDIYFHLKQSACKNPRLLQVVIVEKLFYKLTIKGCNNLSKKRYDCSCLLQGNTLYVTRTSDNHSIFMELSRFFFKGSSDLHLANFLHMVATMAEAGSSAENLEFFTINSQKIPKLSDEESVWTISDVSSMHKIENSESINRLQIEHNPLKPKRKPGISSNWPPTDWKSAPDFQFARLNNFTRENWNTPSDIAQESNEAEAITHTKDWSVPAEISCDWISSDDSMKMATFEDSALGQGESSTTCRMDTDDKEANSSMHIINKVPSSGAFSNSIPGSHIRDQIFIGHPSENHAFITGKRGEMVAYKYFVDKYGPAAVRWVNEEVESGLPYDIVIGGEDENKEYIEVKATKSFRKDWFMISTREWQFAYERGNLFSIAHVILANDRNAKITVFKNPVRLCQRDLLHLVILMPGQQEKIDVIS